ncbi:MAG: hypothetical protein KGI69_01650 [Patescibacteria group bacterium]|nr:hypothetical protein [Patescibacteria group bacterium]
MSTAKSTRYSPESFLKGKIGEFVFEEMFRRAGRFTVLPFGYEKTLPEVAQRVDHVRYKHILENIRSAPDFVIISHDAANVYMVEVKYRTTKTAEEMLEIAKGIQKRWTAIWVFLATPDGFYFDSCTDIVKNGGAMARLNTGWVDEETQREFGELLRKFVPGK